MLERVYQSDFPSLTVNDTYALRELRDDDAEAYFNYYQAPEVGRYILATDPRSLTESLAELRYCRSLFRAKRGFYWGLGNKESGEMIGAVGLYTNNFHHRAELCYDLSSSYWRQGIMSSALRATLAYCFNEAEMQRVEAVTMVDNEPSQAILLAMGFEFEGILKSYRYYEGRFYDIKMYGMTKDMYQKIAPETSSDELDNLFEQISDSPSETD